VTMAMPAPAVNSGPSSTRPPAEPDPATVDKLRQWIVAAKPQSIEIGLDTDLIEQGALDSLQMVNFLLFIEEMRGDEIPEALIRTQYFTSLRVIAQMFFGARGA
jgi:acyl carrier protein